MSLWSHGLRARTNSLPFPTYPCCQPCSLIFGSSIDSPGIQTDRKSGAWALRGHHVSGRCASYTVASFRVPAAKPILICTSSLKKRPKGFPKTIRKCCEIGPKMIQIAKQKVAFIFSAGGSPDTAEKSEIRLYSYCCKQHSFLLQEQKMLR